MKKTVFLLIACLMSVNLYSQTEIGKKNTIGTNFAFGGGIYNFLIKGDAGYNTKYYYSVGFNYSRKLSERLDLYSGIEYTYVDLMVTPSFTGIKKTPYKEHHTLATIPVLLKYNFGKLVYLNGGMLINISDKTSEQREIQNNLIPPLGFSIGIGLDYEFDSGFILTMNPFFKFPSSISSLHYATLHCFQTILSKI